MAYIEKFCPRDGVSPEHLFGPYFAPESHCLRYTCYADLYEMIIYTDGCCSNSGRLDARAGCGFIYGPPTATNPVTFRLEEKGPTGEHNPQTKDRADLRAMIGALQFRKWEGEGWRRLVIASDSTYVIKGLTETLTKWMRHGWKLEGGEVPNKDLWVKLEHEVRSARGRGLEVLFWLIPKEWNKADEAAALGAKKVAVMDFTVI